MIVVAVAGGTGGIGRAIVNSIIRNAKHKVVILARKVSLRFMFKLMLLL